MLISVILGLIFSLIIVLVFIKFEYAIALYLAYYLLVPIARLPIDIPIPIGSKFMCILFFVVFVANYRARIQFKPLEPFIYFFLGIGILILFQGTGLMLENYRTLFYRILTCILFPIVIYGTVVLLPEKSKCIKWALLVSGTIFTLYGLFLTTMPGVNPYLMVLMPIFGEEFNVAYALGYSGLSGITDGPTVDGRMFGRISSVFKHPMTYCLNLGFFLFFINYVFREHYKVIRLLYQVAIIVAILVSGVRTPILALVLTLLVAVLYRRKVKYALYTSAAMFIFAILLSAISDDLYNYVGTIFGSNKTEVSGSSLSMRINQFISCFDIIANCPLQGKGYDWSNVYLNLHQVHPKLLAFESLIYVVLCNTGIVGVCLWTRLIIKIKQYCNIIKNQDFSLFIISISVYYLAYSCITGEYGYMEYYLIYFSLFAGLNEASKRRAFLNIRNK